MSPATLVLLAIGAVLANVIDPGFTFYKYAQQYCGGGGVANADIGDGNMVHLYEDTIPMRTGQAGVGSGVPATNVTCKGEPGCGGCDEKDGNTCQHVSDNYFWCNYDQYLCMSKYVSNDNQQYSDLQKSINTKDWVFQEYFDNYNNETQTSTFARAEKLDNSYSWTFSTTVGVSNTLSITAKIPDLFSATESFTLTVDRTSTQAQTHTEEKSWSVSQEIKIPPRSTVKATFTVEKMIVSGQYQATMKLPNYAKLWCNDRVNGHYEWFMTADDFLSSAYESCSGNTCNIGGPFTGWQGVSSWVNVTHCPLGVHC
eukprot:NODE_2216_length_1111_cov_51.555894_g2198_i0.p1 GENE.NODE_2216_length_1111_cov_51.555894_g2198_i0~~NODE_2216_length_1111_cov_51.555894_g2198_i0.p1  ORF type:complete len:313 (-),score=62.63 NODE_2216_length_1111_cov_51.555894_g2198_i0:92-1030(-)